MNHSLFVFGRYFALSWNWQHANLKCTLWTPKERQFGIRWRRFSIFFNLQSNFIDWSAVKASFSLSNTANYRKPMSEDPVVNPVDCYLFRVFWKWKCVRYCTIVWDQMFDDFSFWVIFSEHNIFRISVSFPIKFFEIFFNFLTQARNLCKFFVLCKRWLAWWEFWVAICVPETIMSCFGDKIMI